MEKDKLVRRPNKKTAVGKIVWKIFRELEDDDFISIRDEEIALFCT